MPKLQQFLRIPLKITTCLRRSLGHIIRLNWSEIDSQGTLIDSSRSTEPAVVLNLARSAFHDIGDRRINGAACRKHKLHRIIYDYEPLWALSWKVKAFMRWVTSSSVGNCFLQIKSLCILFHHNDCVNARYTEGLKGKVCSLSTLPELSFGVAMDHNVEVLFWTRSAKFPFPSGVAVIGQTAKNRASRWFVSFYRLTS